MTRIALGHHVAGFEHGVRDLRDAQVLVERLLGTDDGRVRGQHEMDPRVRDQVGLELRDVDVEGPVEP